MARGVTYVVYVLPVVFSVIFGTIVMADVLQEPGRELNMMRFGSLGEGSHGDIQIIGLQNQYSVKEPVQIQVTIDDSYSCGDLYITIYDSKREAVTQSGFSNNVLMQKTHFFL